MSSDGGLCRGGSAFLMPLNEDNEIRRILSSSRTVAVVGASDKPWRDSNDIMRYLMGRGYRVFAVNPNYKTVLDQTCYANLKDVPEPIDIVDVFRRSESVPAIVREAISVKAKTSLRRQLRAQIQTGE